MKKKQSNRRGKTTKKVHEIVNTWLDSWSQTSATTSKPAPLVKQWSVEQAEAILDYLHGDTSANEVKACCYYEYARASEIIRKARQEYDRARACASKLLHKARQRNDRAHDVALNTIINDFPLFRNDWRKLEILICPGYPALAWRELTQAQRKEILEHFAKTKPPLLNAIRTQSFILNSIGIFERFKQQAMADAREWRERPGPYPAIVGDDEIKYVALPFDYTQGKDAIKEAFSRWLDTEPNRKLFKKYYKKPIHKQKVDSPVHYKALLKYLAAWRLYDELEFKTAAKWTKENRRQRTDTLSLRPFFRENRGKRLNVSPLYKEPRQWQGAIAKARSFLATGIECACGMT